MKVGQRRRGRKEWIAERASERESVNFEGRFFMTSLAIAVRRRCDARIARIEPAASRLALEADLRSCEVIVRTAMMTKAG